MLTVCVGCMRVDIIGGEGGGEGGGQKVSSRAFALSPSPTIMSVSPPPPVLSPPSPPGSPRADAPGARGWDGISRGFGPRAAELVDGPADGLADRPADEGTSAVATADIARLRAKTYLSDQE